MRQTIWGKLKFPYSSKARLKAVTSYVTTLFVLVTWSNSCFSSQLRKVPAGIAWRVRGQWKADNASASIVTGDPVAPGTLLQPVTGSSQHSIIVLLPDGQQVMYECFQPEDCDRSFRVPELLRQPDSFTLEMLARIRAVLGPKGRGSEVTEPVRGIVIAPLSGHRADIAGPVATLPDGTYSFDVVPVGSEHPSAPRQIAEKKSKSISISFPRPGLYILELANDQKLIHSNILVAALEPSRAESVRKSLDAVHTRLQDFSEDFGAWPAQDFEHDYLRSLVLNIAPDSPTTSLKEVRLRESSDQTAEPTFSPHPGIFPIKNKNIAYSEKILVTLHCATPGAEIHYTVDTAQPFRTSPVYQGPVTVMGIGLTIKAFATSPGKKPSPVVTGTFHFED